MTDAPRAATRPSTDAGLAAALVLAAATAAVTEAPAPVRSVLVLLAVAATAARLARHRGRGGLDAAMVATGGLLVLLVLVGLALGLARTGLGPIWWAVGTSVVALVALGISAARPPAVRTPAAEPEAAPDEVAPAATAALPRRSWWLLTPWMAASVAVTVVALVIATRSATDAEVAPVQVALSSVDSSRAVVVVSADQATGPLELRTDAGDDEVVTYPSFSVPAGGSVTTDVELPASGRVEVSVSNEGQTQPLRTLVVNR